ncbi:MAG: hypothetical protein AB1631_00810 [Acidobacteriota bacterium]
MIQQIKAAIKYLMSFIKTDWQLSDYPIRFRYQKTDPSNLSSERLKPIPWVAQIINWWQISGLGQTKKEALADLEKSFNQFKERGKQLPRPGTGLPIEFASSVEISSYEDVALDFFDKILDMNYRECWISDESSLWDFHAEESNEHLNQKILMIYGVDVSDIESGNLVKIFERISTRHSRF